MPESRTRVRILLHWCMALLLGLSLLASPAAATTVTPTGAITGQVEKTWLKAGGSAKLGDPIGKEVKVRVSGVNTYGIHTQRGFVYWDSKQGGKTWQRGKAPALSGVDNERDALAASGLNPGVLYRSAKLCTATSNAKRQLTQWVRGGTIIDLRTSGTASRCKDPTLPGISKVRHSMTPTANTATFVTKASDRKAVANVLKKIANSNGVTLLHCTHGRDRTGWVVAVVMMVGGADLNSVLTEYRRSPGTKDSDLRKGVVAMYDNYDGLEGYLLDGLGLDQRTIDKLADRIT